MYCPDTARRGNLVNSASTKPVYEHAFQLLRLGDTTSIEKGLALLLAEVEAHPLDAKARFEYAGAFDFIGLEVEALKHYERVLEYGYERLPLEDQPRLFVQLGSTLRNLKQFSKARSTLSQGLKKFPSYTALKAFLALTEYSCGNHAESVKLLFETLLVNPTDTSLQRYGNALRRYSDRVDD